MKFANRLAASNSGWKAWYFVLALLAFVLGSQLSLLSQWFGAVITPVQFIAFSVLALWFVRLAARRWPTVEDLALKRTLSWHDIGWIAAVFVVTHAVFQLLSWGMSTDEQRQQAVQYFNELGFENGTFYAVMMVLASVICAPVCEELLYRGIILRSAHDALARKIPLLAATVAAVLFSALLFALPHLGDSLLNRFAVAYLISGIGFGLVYVQTGSLTAAMVSHSLQSCYAFATILLFGRGDAAVSPMIYLLVFACPLWTYLCARLLWRILPKAELAAD
ncbi:MAG: type II CAAX endopeptidase family protein [Neisseria sp.]|nr:type II CAAX endopeptidase family protein [Neisseria sp.]